MWLRLRTDLPTAIGAGLEEVVTDVLWACVAGEQPAPGRDVGVGCSGNCKAWKTCKASDMRTISRLTCRKEP